jgi:hypothetical protein
MPEALQWQPEILKEARGLPWAPKPTEDEDPPKKEEPVASLPLVHNEGTATPRVNPPADSSSGSSSSGSSSSGDDDDNDDGHGGTGAKRKAAAVESSDDDLADTTGAAAAAATPTFVAPGTVDRARAALAAIRGTSSSAASAPAATLSSSSAAEPYSPWVNVAHGRWKRSLDDSTLVLENKSPRIEALEESLSEAKIEAETLVIPNTDMLDADKNERLEARKAEVAKLEYFQAFEWVTKEEAAAQGLKYIKSRWEDVRKYDARKASIRSRWVLQDFRGKQAEPTMFAPTPSLVAVRLVEAIGVQNGWDLVTGDVSTAYNACT